MPGRNFTDEEEAEIAKIYLAGTSARAIARSYGFGHHISIVSALNRQNVTQRTPPERNRLYKVNPYAFDVIDEEAAYWWGFLYADGNVGREKTITVALSVKDQIQIERFRNFLQSDAPIDRATITISSGKYERLRFSVTERHLAKRLINLGVIPKRHNFEYAIKNLPQGMERHWLRGLFDGDGSINYQKNGQPTITLCGGVSLLSWIREILAKYASRNPDHRITKHIKANLYYLTYAGRRQVAAISHFMYDGAHTYMERKHDIAISSYIEPPPRLKDDKGRFV